MDAVRGVDTILETESQVQGERKGTMRCHVVAVTVIIMTTMNNHDQGGIKCGNRGTGFLDSEGSHR